MNKFKLIMGVALVFLVGVFAGVIGSGIYYEIRLRDFTAGGPPQDVRIRMLLDRFSHDLRLTDVQKNEIEKILADMQERVFELRRKTFPELEELNKKSLDLIREKLDSRQREKFNSFDIKMREIHDRFAEKLDFPGRPPLSEIIEMKDVLELSPEQLKEIEKIIENGRSEREKLRIEQDSQPPYFSQVRQKMMESEVDQRRKIEEILTPKQMEIYKERMEEEHLRRPFDPPPAPANGPRPSPRW